jgi:galactose mutarotase-like enzyme
MPIHGFGASSAWEGAQDSSHAARFRLETREGEREEFPFASLFESRVALSGDALELRLKVTRAGRCGVEGLMPVACGWHPYFRLAAFGQEDLSRVKFACEARACLEVTPGGGAGSSSPRDWSKPISINDPYLGSRIIGDWHEGRCALGLERGPRLEMTFGPAPLVSYGVLWVKPERGFACVEPWMGLPDAVHTGMGVRWLRPGERFEMTMCLAWRAG